MSMLKLRAVERRKIRDAAAVAPEPIDKQNLYDFLIVCEQFGLNANRVAEILEPRTVRRLKNWITSLNDQDVTVRVRARPAEFLRVPDAQLDQRVPWKWHKTNDEDGNRVHFDWQELPNIFSRVESGVTKWYVPMSGDGIEYFDFDDSEAVKADLWVGHETFDDETIPAADTEGV